MKEEPDLFGNNVRHVLPRAEDGNAGLAQCRRRDQVNPATIIRAVGV
jgi:hypothetical protein